MKQPDCSDLPLLMGFDSSRTFQMRDEFNRKKFADDLISILRLKNGPTTIAVNGAWGVGKTEFATKVANLLISQLEDKTDDATKIATPIPVWFDAYVDDCLDNPLFSLVGRIIALEKTELFPFNAVKQVKEAAISLIKNTPKYCFSALLHHLEQQLGSNLISDVKSALSTGINPSLSALQKTLESQSSRLLEIETLKQKLEELCKTRPICLFIDELDRCRPTYALAVLEVVKHFFSVGNLKVVFIVNQKQLQSVISHQYGINDDDSFLYLSKFIDLRLDLPLAFTPANATASQAAYVKYLEVLINEKGLNKPGRLLGDPRAYDLLKQLVLGKEHSLRDMERLVREILINSMRISLSNDVKENCNTVLAAYLCVFHRELAFTLSKLDEPILNHPDVIELLNSSKNQRNIEDYIAYLRERAYNTGTNGFFFLRRTISKCLGKI